MSASSLESVGFENYHRLLQASLPGLIGSGVYDAGGELVWSAGGEQADRFLLPAVASLGVPLSVWVTSGEPVPQRVVEGARVLFGVGVGGEGSRPAAVLVILVEDRAGRFAGAADTPVREALETVAACLRTEYQLVEELGAMAGELADRYEELNLLYTTDDQADDFAKGQVALQTLVRNCVEFLDVVLAALIVPDKQLTLHHGNDNAPLPGVDGCLAVLRDELYGWMEANKQSVVINDAADPLRARVCLGGSHKVLSCPVMQGGIGLSGMLVCVNPAGKRDFTNSDRNLLEVMARKAAKLIQGSYDSLTGLMNSHGFEWRLERCLLAAQQNGVAHCVINVDLDRLQVVNDISGRRAGDALLRRVAEVIRAQVRAGDTVARMGEDSFGVLLEGCPLDLGTGIAARISAGIREIDFSWDTERHEVSASLGVAPVTRESRSVVQIITAVELARNAAKEQGRGRLQVFQDDNRELRQRRGEIQWVNRIQQALREDRLLLHAQPIRPLGQQRECFHFEILVRMQLEPGKLVPPGAFLPAAEQYFLMPAIDRWVIEHSLAMLAASLPELYGCRGSAAINLSGQSITEDGFLEFIIGQTQRYPALVPWLCFEVTESAAIANLAQAGTFISVLRERGCRFSLDDFGTGLSSFAYLKNLHVDYLKIDGAFVKEIDRDPIAEAMVGAINQVGHIVGLQTIAEYVENDRVRECLEEMGVDYGQGYGLGRPRPFDEHLRELAALARAGDGLGRCAGMP